MKESYRSRIYKNYINSRIAPPVSASAKSLPLRSPFIQNLIKRYFPVDLNARIMDLGCGHGQIVHYARLAGYSNIVGIDGSMEQVQLALQLGVEGVSYGDISSSLSVVDSNSQDCIVTFDVIEHFTRDELVDLVDAIYRVLKPGGRWVIHVPNGESPFFGRVRYGDMTHELAFTRVSISQLLHASGFSQVECFEDYPIPHGFKSLIRWGLWKIIRGALRLYIAVETGDSARDAIFSQNLLSIAVK